MSVSLVKPQLTAGVFGEGPHWEVATKSLLYVDMTGKAIHRWNAATDIDEVVKLDIEDSPSLVVPRQSGGYVITHGTTVSHLEWSSGTLTTLETIAGVASEMKVRFNDGKCDSRGRLWAGTFPAEYKDIMSIAPNQGYLVSVTRGSVQKQADGITVSNGMAWSADERTLYFVDTIPKEILAFDFDVDTGTLSNRRVAVAFPPDSRDTLGMPDGMTIDTDGKLWVACVPVGKVACFDPETANRRVAVAFPPDSRDTLGLPDGMTIDTDGKLWVVCVMAGKVACFDPETGKLLRTIEFPVKGVTSCCFGGDNMDEMYVTSAYRDIFGDQIGGSNPPGSVFKVTGLGVKGRPDHVYQDTH